MEMKASHLLLVALLPLSATLAAQDAPADRQAAIEAHVRFLASDAMKGREAGSGEYDIAAQYVAARFFAAGLKPGGDAGYLQTVPLVRYRTEGESRATLSRGGRSETLAAGSDYAAIPDPMRAKVSVDAPVVFAGYGTDFDRLDVAGKIVAVLPGAPRTLNSEVRAYLGSVSTKARAAAARGAVGVIQLPAPGKARPLPTMRPRMTWAEPDGAGHADAPIPILASFSEAGARKLFAGARVSWDAKTPRAGALPVRLAFESGNAFEAARSANVIGVLPGSDPGLADEVLVLSAHLDHIGIGAPDAKGDTINNGALDDAIGIASLIEEARRFREKAPRRTIMFVAFTAEEKGLIGSSWFTAHLPQGRRVVADVNLDMPILTYRFQDMVAFGGDRSTLGPVIARALAGIGVTLSPDPMPDEAIFVRSDHFNFVRRGIPAVFLWPGPKGEGKAATDDFMKNRYHKPSDDLSQPILWDQAVRFVDANYRIAREIADADAPPVWNKGDYFGMLFKGPMAR